MKMISTLHYMSYPPPLKAKENANDYHYLNFTEKNLHYGLPKQTRYRHNETMDFDDFVALMEYIEDARSPDQAYMEYLADPATYTMDEVLDALGLTRGYFA